MGIKYFKCLFFSVSLFPGNPFAVDFKHFVDEIGAKM